MSGDCIVRRIERRDLAELVAMCAEHACYERSEYDPRGKTALLEHALFDPNPRLTAWIAELGKHRVGYVSVTSDFSTWAGRAFLHMDCLFVREAYRGAGIGAALLAAAMGFAAEQGYSEMQWQTPVWNDSAARFYRRSGATGVAKLRFALAIAAERARAAGSTQSNRIVVKSRPAC